MELRKATRYRLNAPAFYWWESADGTLQEAQGITRDISDRGVFILAKQAPPAGVRVEVDVYLPAVSAAARSAQLHGEGAVLNGIAYDATGDRLFVTGKLWPKLFEIKVISRP